MCQALRELMNDEIEAEKAGAVTAAVDDRNEEMAEDMLRDSKPLEEIKKYSRLAESTIREIAKKINVTVLA